MLRPEGRIFFANAEQLAHKARLRVEEAHPRIIVLDMRAVFDLEYTALKMLIDAEKKNRERGIRLWLVGMNPDVLSMVQKSTLAEALGREGMYLNLEAAVATFLGENATLRSSNHEHLVA